MMMLHDLVRGLAEFEITGPSDVMVGNVTGDSRKVQPQDLFVAVRGTVIDGHNNVADAVRNGATVIVGERHIHELSFDHGEAGISVTYVRVPDTRSVHAELLRRSQPEIVDALTSIEFYGVTGTNGKTTVATILEQLLLASGRITGFIGTTGIRYRDIEIEATHTTPDVERLYEIITMMYRAGVQAVAMEVSSHALDQDRINGIHFTGAVFTNLTRDHLDYHHTMEAYAVAKQKLFLGLSERAVAIFNADDSWAPFMRRGCKAHTTVDVGTSATNEMEIANISTGAHGALFTMRAHGVDNTPVELTIQSPLIGHFNVMNVALCVTLLWGRGHAVPELERMVTTIRGPRGRMERIALDRNITAVIDYAHTPDALEKALTTLRSILHEHGARLHVVFGCGGDRDAGKRPQMGSVAAALADMVWITSDNPRTEDPLTIMDQIADGVPLQIRTSVGVHVIEDRRAAILAALSNARENDVVLIAGKGHEEYQVIGLDKIPFSDRHVVEQFRT
jgi:UDP-N-acetylmuramoyl-L-alanyl-D-glutamate--2,6-diaminopimelate ligase